MALLSESLNITNNSSLGIESRFVMINNPNTTANVVLVSQETFFSNVRVNPTFSNTVSANNLHITYSTTPTTSTDAVTKGKIWFDDNYLYVAVANNSIKRVALSSF